MKWIEEKGWAEALRGERGKEYFAALERFVDDAYRTGIVYPPREKIFAAFERTPLAKTRVVIIGQDPYHEEGQAQGLAFYVPWTVKSPPSLVNIAKELKAEAQGLDARKLKAKDVVVPDLLAWAEQGVLLLNTTLTVAEHNPLSHAGKGWETFTDAVLKILSAREEPLVFLLWGAAAQRKGALIDRNRHRMIECAHPSPLSASRGFFGSDCFKKVNSFLAEKINWNAQSKN